MAATIIKDLLQQTNRGRIVCLNLEHAENENYLDGDLVKKLDGLLMEKLLKTKAIRNYSDTIKEALEAVHSLEDKKEILFQIDTEYLCAAVINCISDIVFNDPQKDFILKRKQARSCDKEYVSCIKTSSILTFMLDDAKLTDSGLLIKPAIPPDFSDIDTVKRKKLVKHLNKILADKVQRKKYLKLEAKFWDPFIPFIWLTDSREIKKIKEEIKPNEYANVVRDRLGLAHIGCHELLFEFRIPFLSIKNHNLLALPSFLEGIGHNRFKVFVDGEPDGSCGRTTNLQFLLDFINKRSPLDGLPEFVASIDLFTNLDDWEFEVIGFTSTHSENFKPTGIRSVDKVKRNQADAHYITALTTKYC